MKKINIIFITFFIIISSFNPLINATETPAIQDTMITEPQSSGENNSEVIAN